jgi:iron complex transport system ATP-binding protein
LGRRGRRANLSVVTVLRAQSLGHAIPGRTLYDGLDLELRPGRITAVVGPNGAGKSTLLRQLAGLGRPQRGRVCLDNIDLHALPPRQRARQLAYLPQDGGLAFDLAVRDLVILGRAPYLPAFGPPAASDHAAVAAALHRLDLQGLAERSVRSLSGGERQRVMLARMLVSGAGVLVLDEPAAALDIGHSLALLTQLRALAAGGAAVVLALHDLDLARRYSDDAVLLGGATCSVGPARHVLSARYLGPAFGVAVREHGEHILFDPA